MVSAFIGRTQWRQPADQLRPKVPKLAMDEGEADVRPRDFPVTRAKIRAWLL